MKWILYCLFICWSSLLVPLLACDIGAHHSILYHYNSAQKVVEAVVLKRQKQATAGLDLPLYRLRLKVKKAYKNAVVGETFWITVPEAYLPKLGSRYLYYAVAKLEASYLHCAQPIRLADPAARQKQAFLHRLNAGHTGSIKEYTPTGQLWATGQLNNGQAEGIWHYYAQTGELQLVAQYKNGQATGTWQHYHHLSDANYKLLQAIIAGEEAQKMAGYQMIALNELDTGRYTKELCYQVGQDTVLELFHFRQAKLARQVSYQEGWRTGAELHFNLSGLPIKYYQFQAGKLEGTFWELYPLELGSLLKVQGSYQADEKYEEQHLYYKNNQLQRTEIILQEGKVPAL